MEKFKSILLKFPEFYLIIVAIRIGFVGKEEILITLLGTILVVGLILQIIFKNKFSGFIIAALFTFLNFYMLLAVLFEFSEFPFYTSEAIKMLLFGLLFFTFNMAVAGVMYKYSKNTGSLINGFKVQTRG